MREMSYKVSGVVTKDYATAKMISKRLKAPIEIVLTEVIEEKAVDSSRYEKVRQHFMATH